MNKLIPLSLAAVFAITSGFAMAATTETPPATQVPAKAAAAPHHASKHHKVKHHTKATNVKPVEDAAKAVTK